MDSWQSAALFLCPQKFGDRIYTNFPVFLELIIWKMES